MALSSAFSKYFLIPCDGCMSFLMSASFFARCRTWWIVEYASGTSLSSGCVPTSLFAWQSLSMVIDCVPRNVSPARFLPL